MEQQVIDFIHRRFPDKSDWMTGNCYFFAQILVSRFSGDIVYDPIEGHFLFYGYDENFYDWSGKRDYTKEQISKFVMWPGYTARDPHHHSRIWRDCIK